MPTDRIAGKDGASRSGCVIDRCSETAVVGGALCLIHAELVSRPLPERLEKRCSSR